MGENFDDLIRFLLYVSLCVNTKTQFSTSSQKLYETGVVHASFFDVITYAQDQLNPDTQDSPWWNEILHARKLTTLTHGQCSMPVLGH